MELHATMPTPARLLRPGRRLAMHQVQCPGFDVNAKCGAVFASYKLHLMPVGLLFSQALFHYLNEIMSSN